MDGSDVAPQAVTSSGPGLGVQNVTINLHHKQLTGFTTGLDSDTQYIGTLYKHLLAYGYHSLNALGSRTQLSWPIPWVQILLITPM